jgi:undecaprenyl-diphosphatase
MFLSIPANLGYALLAGFIAGESAGLPLPAETALVTAGLMATVGHLSLPLVIGVAAGAAVVGDNLGYWAGRRAGRRFLRAHRGPFRLQRQRLLAWSEEFFARSGLLAVVLARFVPGLRTCAAAMAGAGRMPAGRFLIANAGGALLWAGLTTLVVAVLGAAGAVITLASGSAAIGLVAAVSLRRAARGRRGARAVRAAPATGI